MNNRKFIVEGINIIDINYSDNNDDFYAQISCEISEVDTPGGEAIIVYIASVERIKYLFENEKNVLWKTDLLIVKEFNTEDIVEMMQKIIDNSNSKSWIDLSEYLESYFSWI